MIDPEFSKYSYGFRPGALFSLNGMVDAFLEKAFAEGGEQSIVLYGGVLRIKVSNNLRRF